MTSQGPSARSTRLRLLGAPAIVDADGQAFLLNAGDAVLLAFLALQGETERRRLASLLWPEAAPAAALNSLRQRIFKLHRVGGPGLPHVRDGTLALAPGVVHDLADPELTLATNALALAEPLLGDAVYDPATELGTWVAARRQQWSDRVHDALAGLASAREEGGRIADALVYATRLVAAQPLHEHGVRLLMRLHHRRGDRGAALAAYERCVHALHEALGEAPGEETIALAQAISAGRVLDAAPMRPMPLGLRHPPRLVGRDALLAAAHQRWQAGGAVLLRGPAGIGKTRIFDELVARWRIAVVVRLQPDDATTALALAHRLAAAIAVAAPGATLPPGLLWLAAPNAHPAPAGALHAERLAEWIRQAFAEAALRGVAIDNVHCADPESMEALARLLPDGAASPPQQWLLAARDEPLPPALAAWLAEVESTLAPNVGVEPLPLAAVAELVASLELPQIRVDPWAARLHAHCGGHPLHLLQVLRNLHERGRLAQPAPPPDMPLPPAALRSVRRWLDASAPDVQQLAFVAALAGADFAAELAADVMGCPAIALAMPWRRLEELGMLHGPAFSHELIRQAVLDALPAALQPLLRRQIAAALAARGLSAERRALHWEAAGCWSEAAADHRLVAERLLALGLTARAVGALRAAAAASERTGDAAAAFELLWRAGSLALASESANVARDAAVALLERAHDDRQRALAWTLLAQVRAELQDASALDAAMQALAHAQRSGDAALLGRARLREAGALMAAGRHAEALQALRDVQRSGAVLLREEQLDLDDALAVTLGRLGLRNEALATSDAGLALALAAGDKVRAAIHAGNRAVLLGYLQRVPEALHACEDAIAYGHESGTERGFLLVDEMGLAGLYQDLGRFAEALALAERVVDALTAAGYAGWALNAENGLAGLYMVLGRLDLAQRRLGDPAADAPPWTRVARWVTRARLERLRGRPSLPWLARARHEVEAAGIPIDGYIRHRIAVELASASTPAEAVVLTGAAIAWARANEHLALERTAAIAAIDAHLRAGAVSAAAACAESVEATADGRWVAYNGYQPEHWWTLARAWQAAGAPARARAFIERAADWIRARADADVPAPFRDSFLSGNAVNRAVLEAAAAPPTGAAPTARAGSRTGP